ncbi:MAG TPA: hypothetical protein VIV60_35230 [Polyangiaceae bacterium]
MLVSGCKLTYLVPICAAAIWSCSGAPPKTTALNGPRTLSIREPSTPGKRTVLVFMPETPQTREVLSGLSDEIEDDARLVVVRIDSSSESNIVAETIVRYAPSAIVLLNNTSVTAYREYQHQRGGSEFPPAVIVMASFLESQARKLRFTTGISYEIPLITAVTNLRRLVVLSRERIGVVVRAPLRDFVESQIQLATRERVRVTQEEVSASPNPSEVKRAIRLLKQRCDVIWILNDDRLLTPQLIADAWVPGLDERPWVPSLVGAASLVSAKNSLGTFAVLPDHAALGAQAGSLIDDIAANGWKLSNADKVQLPLSTTTTIDLVQVKERFALQPTALQQVDKILE